MKCSSILLFLLVLLSPGIASAQTEKGEWKRPKHNGKITNEYDRTNDQTKLALGLMPVTCVKDGCIFISLDSSFPGAKLKSPVGRVILGLSIVTKTLKPFAAPKLVFRLDGESMALGEMTFAGEVPAGELTGLPYGIPLTGDELANIAGAHKVEVEIGGFRFALGENALNAIKDYNHQVRAVH
ncbi:MAG TPA: hypothetical protein VIQ24_21930 [Pyrinomonadaceae bacterium]